MQALLKALKTSTVAEEESTPGLNAAQCVFLFAVTRDVVGIAASKLIRHE